MTTASLEPLQAVQKKYCSRALLLTVLVAGGLILFGQTALGKGLILGTVFSLMNFMLMAYAIPRKVGRSRGKTLLAALGSLGGRFVLLAVPMVLALKFATFHAVTTMIGIFAVQLMILADYLVKPFFRITRKNASGEC